MSQLLDTYVLELALLLKTKVLKLPGKKFPVKIVKKQEIPIKCVVLFLLHSPLELLSQKYD